MPRRKLSPGQRQKARQRSQKKYNDSIEGRKRTERYEESPAGIVARRENTKIQNARRRALLLQQRARQELLANETLLERIARIQREG